VTRGESDSPGARALRAAGYVKLPGWWVTQEQYELVAYMAQQNKATIDEIKEEAQWRNDHR
jgi:hypothetical protein